MKLLDLIPLEVYDVVAIINEGERIFDEVVIELMMLLGLQIAVEDDNT